ncbi:hypothetical protein RRG08_016290 [Elysia crispata]|uniref:Uncharacterized protein n=1 Tax=Elysia crispata TaxID=231223 RepID=A0AAE1B5U4_9GAST|nr:hypothetical protein RRG08_016290 [Elysia crispata]
MGNLESTPDGPLLNDQLENDLQRRKEGEEEEEQIAVHGSQIAVDPAAAAAARAYQLIRRYCRPGGVLEGGRLTSSQALGGFQQQNVWEECGERNKGEGKQLSPLTLIILIVGTWLIYLEGRGEGRGCYRSLATDLRVARSVRPSLAVVVHLVQVTSQVTLAWDIRTPNLMGLYRGVSSFSHLYLGVSSQEGRTSASV